MEKKSIGEFIAVLRKANGLTQKQLAEMLRVSDKTVSRWERSETAPDLTLIPVIAEIFGITSDELLRGERRVSSTEVRESAQMFSPPGEKQIQYILANVRTKYWIRSMVSVAITLIGIILAIGCAELFRRSSNGFVAGLVVILITYLTAVLCQIIHAIAVFASVSADEFNGKTVEAMKRKIVMIAVYLVSGMGILCVAGIVTICGFDLFEWVPLTLFWVAVAAMGYLILWQIVKNILIRRGCTWLEKEMEQEKQ